MTASLEGIQRILQQIRAELPLLVQSSQIAPQQIVIGEGLSDIDRRMGLLQAGEFRTGNGVEPGLGFSGVRIGYPAFLYSSALWHIVGVNDDVLQFGLRASDGVAVAGGGVVTLDEDGVTITAPTSPNDLNSYKFVSGSAVVGGLYGFSTNSDNFQINLQSINSAGDFGKILITATGDSQGSVSLYAQHSGGNAAQILITQGASSGSIMINAAGQNVDTLIGGDTDANLVVVDASTDRVGIGTAAPTAKLNVEGAVIINDTGADIDVRIESDGDANNFFSDGGTNRVGIGTGAPGYKLDVAGDVNISTGSVYRINGTDISSGASLPVGLPRNYKIVPSVASNNLTLALKGLDGNDPSASNPIKVTIANVERTITSALSVTVNAGANTFNAGSSELATKEVDYFAYLSWRAASSAVVLGFSRISHATLYSDFSGTATNEKYAAFSTAPASTDDVVVIGRFAATLSAGAGYTWTVPTYTAKNLIQRPIWNSRLLTWVPTVAAGSGTFTTLGTITGTYQVIDEGKIYTELDINITTNGTAASYVSATPPFTISDQSKLFGRQDAIGGRLIASIALTSGTLLAIIDYNNAYPGASGERLSLLGTLRMR